MLPRRLIMVVRRLPRRAREVSVLLPLNPRQLRRLGYVLSAIVSFVAVQAVVSAYIHPADIAAAQTIEPTSGAYCDHLATSELTSLKAVPAICQAPAIVAAALVPATIPYTGDDYAYGNCTFWAALRRAQIGRPIPNTWGDAVNWASNARAEGFPVDQTPAPG